MKNRACHVCLEQMQRYYYEWIPSQICVNKSHTFTVGSAPAVTGSVFMQRLRLCWGQPDSK